jgi:hypothetical protein
VSVASVLLPLLVAGATSAAVPGGPAPGRYEARLCVTVGAQSPNCGPVEAEVNAAGELQVQVHDIRYLVVFVPGGLVGITMHGAVQVAEFQSSYRWAGQTLLFADAPRGLQYELQLSPPPAQASAAAR